MLYFGKSQKAEFVTAVQKSSIKSRHNQKRPSHYFISRGYLVVASQWLKQMSYLEEEYYYCLNDQQHKVQLPLGKPVVSEMDEFLENFRTAFEPPPAPFSGKMLRLFSTKFFRSEMTPPKNCRF